MKIDAILENDYGFTVEEAKEAFDYYLDGGTICNKTKKAQAVEPFLDKEEIEEMWRLMHDHPLYSSEIIGYYEDLVEARTDYVYDAEG